MSSTTTNNGIFRRKKIYFTQVSNNILRDNKISLKAKGLYSLIQSYVTIEDFVLYKTFLMKQCKEGEKAFESTWKELKDNGYLVQYRLQDKKGIFYYEYELLDEVALNDDSKEKNKDLNTNKTSEKVHNPKKGDMDINNHTPKKEVVENGQGGESTCGKQGVYNNTNSSNTNLNNTDGNKIDSNGTKPSSNLDTTIEKFYALIKNEMTEVSFKTWIEPLTIHITNQKAIIETKDKFTYEIIKDRYLDFIKKNFKHIGINKIDIKEKND